MQPPPHMYPPPNNNDRTIGNETGKEIDNPHCAGKTMVVWHTMEALFASFHKGKADKV